MCVICVTVISNKWLQELPPTLFRWKKCYQVISVRVQLQYGHKIHPPNLSFRFSSFHTVILTISWCISSIMAKLNIISGTCLLQTSDKKGKVAHTRLPSVRFQSGSRFLAVSLQVTSVRLPLLSARPAVTIATLKRVTTVPVSLLGEDRHDGCEQFA